jgi:glycosyltransferase involved in cell wall biosynthesis/peptidoglycan/xylan/chitin deacetylase (PgdA/CDA1 family)
VGEAMNALIRKSWDFSFRLLPPAILMRMAVGKLFAPCYHLVTNGSPRHVRHLYEWRGTKEFEADLDYLLKYFTPLSLAELYELITDCRPLPKHAFFLSFDDGFREMSEIVAPICRAKGIPATFFLTTSFLDNRNLGFRHKTSLLIERCEELGPRCLAPLAQLVKERGLPALGLGDLRGFLSSIRYQDRAFLDDAAAILEVDFDEYLRVERPYLTSAQVGDLVAQGFSIGGHSIDHPLYADVPLREQVRQTQGCMADLIDRFHPAVRAFAFPFVSDGIPEEYYLEVFSQQIVDLVFCIGAMPRAHRSLSVQRVGVESPVHHSLARLLREQVSRQMKERVWAGKRQAGEPAKPTTAATGEPLVSILIPAYNAERWIGQSIESALTQTYSPKEVIVVDDGSTDGTAGIIRSFGDRIHFVECAHAGGNAARNVLLDLARGEWLQYLDADDYLLPDKLSDQIQFVKQNDREPDVVYSPFLLRDEATRKAVSVSPTPGQEVTQHFISWTPFWTGALLLRRSALTDVGGWKEDQPCCQEHELLLRLIRKGKRFGLWNQAGAVYREHSTHTVSRKSPLQTIQIRMNLTNQCVDFVKHSGGLTADHRRALYTARMEAARGAWPFDRKYARQLARRASRAGRWWSTGSPALPMRFELASFALGFGWAEKLAERRRAKRALLKTPTATIASIAGTAPLVSILIPAYNAERWIRQAIDSALAQTYAPSEVIVVDDGSTDGTRDLIRSFGDRIRFIERTHRGGNAARNTLLELAQGEWLQYLDADDYLLPDKVADQMRFLAENDNQLDVVYSPFLIRQESSRTQWPSPLAVGGDVAAHFVFWTSFCTHGILLRRSAILEVKGWKEDQLVCQEHELLLRLMEGGKRFGLWSEPGAVYRYHDTGTVSRKDPLQTIRTRMELTDRCERFLKESNRLMADHRKALYVARMEAARSAWSIDAGYARQLVRKASENGGWWTSRSPALPPHFQIALRLVGFDPAQRLARFWRSLSSTH